MANPIGYSRHLGIFDQIQEDFNFFKDLAQGRTPSEERLKERIGFAALRALGVLTMTYAGIRALGGTISILHNATTIGVSGLIGCVGHDAFVISQNLQSMPSTPTHSQPTQTNPSRSTDASQNAPTTPTTPIWEQLKRQEAKEGTWLSSSFWNLFFHP